MDTATLELSGAHVGSLAPTVTLHDVELVTTGMHPGATGPTPVAREDLESMLAAHADPEVDRAPAHPGHFDPRFVQALADGEPALGWVVPRRIVDLPGGAAKLIGDIVDVPAKLAAIIPKAYARRSVEFSPKVTPSGRAYRAALDGLGLLGVAIPAVKGLADIVNRYSAGPPLVAGAQVFLSDTPTADAALHVAWWSSGHDDPHAFVPSPEGGPLMPRFDSARYQQLLAQESARHAQTMAGLLSQSQVADPAVPPLPGYPGMPAPAAPAAPAPAAPAPVAAAPQFDPATGAPIPAAPAAPAAPAPPAPMPAAPAGYAFDAVTGQYVPTAPVPVAPAPVPMPAPVAPVAGWPPAPAAPAAPAPVAGYPAAPAPVPAPAPAGSPFAPAPAATAPAPVPGAPAAPGLPVATLSAGQLSELQARAARGDAAMQALEAQQREHYLTAAVNEGRISIAERGAWATQMAAPGQMAPTVALLSSLTPGRVPVQPLGQAQLAAAPATAGVPDAAWDAWETETFGLPAPAPAPAAPAAAPGAVPVAASIGV